MGRLQKTFYTEEDLLKFIGIHGKIEMQDMQKANSLGMSPYYVYDCITSAGSCGEIYIYPEK